jgi:hypothetical protein
MVYLPLQTSGMDWVDFDSVAKLEGRMLWRSLTMKI